MNPKLDDLWGRVLGAIDPKERERWLIEALTVMMQGAMAVLTDAQPDVMAHAAGLTGPRPRRESTARASGTSGSGAGRDSRIVADPWIPQLRRIGMPRWFRGAAAGVAVGLLLAGCAPGGSTARTAATAGVAATACTPTRAYARHSSIMGEPTSMVARTNTTQISPPGAAVVEQLANSALTEVNRSGDLQPVLAQAVPSVENGLWKLLPDGRMETTWKIRPNVRSRAEEPS